MAYYNNPSQINDEAISIAGGKTFQVIQLADSAGKIIDPTSIEGLSIPPYDYIDLSYTGSNITGVVYKTGGPGGTTVATLTLSYDGSNNLISVMKS